MCCYYFRYMLAISKRYSKQLFNNSRLHTCTYCICILSQEKKNYFHQPYIIKVHISSRDCREWRVGRQVKSPHQEYNSRGSYTVLYSRTYRMKATALLMLLFLFIYMAAYSALYIYIYRRKSSSNRRSPRVVRRAKLSAIDI